MKLSSRSLLLLLAFFLIILSSEFMAAAELNLDYLALQSFRSFADPRGAGLYSWAPRTNLCSGKWLGVFCRGGRVTRLFLSGSNLQGIIHDSLTLLPYLRLLNLSHNHLTGKLPEGFFRLRRLRRIDLSGNSLSGHIPSEIAHLPGLVTLRLEGNRLTGSIPSSLGSFSRIADLNISGNNLFGEIPHASRSFPVSSFSGNSRLCGEPLLRCANNIDNVLQEKHCRKHKAATIASIAAAIIVTILVVLPAVVIYFRKRREPTFKSEKHLEDCKNIVDGIVKEEKKLVFFKGCKPFAADDLLNGWAQTLSQGSIGRMYRVIMEGYPGRGVAVRHLRGVKISAMEQLLSEIGNLRHPNIVDLLAYYCSSGDLFLVYEYLPKRSLHSLLHGNRGPTRTPLSWETRLYLAQGASKGLAFLHGASPSKLTHQKIASYNILIDYDGEAHVADFGLQHLFAGKMSAGQEYDVYAFGVILLEILTGRSAVHEGVNFPSWVMAIRRNGWRSDLLDVELKGLETKEDEMMCLFHLALLCLAPAPSERPSMGMVYRMIREIRERRSTRFEVPGSPSPLLP